MAFPRLPDPEPAVKERMRRLHRETDMSLAAIGALAGYTLQTMRRRRREWGWPDRPLLRHPRQRPIAAADWPVPGAGPPVTAGARPEPSGLAPTTPDAATPLMPAGTLAHQARRLERLVVQRIDHLEAEAALGRDVDPERTDRRLVQLERLLAQLGKRRSGDDNDTQPPARSVAELRDDLRGHLRRLRAAGRSRRVDGDAGAG